MTARKLTHGWNRDKADARDLKFADVRAKLPSFPLAVGVVDMEPPIRDQGPLGGCTGFGTTAGMAVEWVKLGNIPQPLQLSELMAYLLGRIPEGTVAQDAGAEIRDVIKGLATNGCCLEELWPYEIGKFAQEPPDDAWTDALGHTIKAYSALDNADLSQIKTCLAGHDGFPCGFLCPPAFEGDEVAETGFLADPAPGWTAIGGHCVFGARYDDTVRGANWRNPGGILFRNSYGRGFGDPKFPGHFWASYDFVTSAAWSSFWHLTSVGYGPSSQMAP